MFSVYFKWGDEEDQKDFLGDFETRELAEAYRVEQIGMEGWEDIPGTESDQYVIIEK